ncbi:glycine N-acyltransferase-like protein 3 [Myripristis murdjan]|uniref:Glycine N-acyltransferase-like protein n=1 Tax=Myripristis murdjan TaxID=586833 RepID=A0A667Y066_9TELE|nr:glycine N-acyltransferase-like protein 3 [Myripristis murdjan]
MKVLDAEELRVAEGLLFKHLPKSLKVYGFLTGMNRNKVNTVDVVVDKWPDFKVIICRPDLKNPLAQQLKKKVSYYSTDEQILRRMLTEENSLDWSTYFMVGGFDLTHATLLKDVSSARGVNAQLLCVLRTMYLPDCSTLPPIEIESELQSRISSLNDSHVELVNNSWKFGGDEAEYWNIKNLISNFPSCCITDDQGQPVSWILVYNYCAMGILYTLPEHRGKGYAKIVISTLARKLHAEGYPVYCFIEEDNEVSYRLFKKMGFTDDPSYRAAWFEFNF